MGAIPQETIRAKDTVGGRADDPVRDFLAAFSPKEWTARQKRLDRSVEELGLHYEAAELAAGLGPWRLDLLPLILPPEDWEKISSGVVQRARAFNAYAQDLFQTQHLLRDRIVPQDVALRDPAFLRPLSGIEVPNGEYSQFGAFDLVEIRPGDWRVVEHHMGTPFGLAHVLQNRRMLSEVFPELYERVDAAPVAGFSTYLLEMLRAQSHKANPHVLLLTGGQPGQAFFEEALIARHMGISVARPGDLLVRESRVFLRTIRGLEPVDVIYRRVESASLDPIAVPAAGGLGVPGLINVWRKGNVSIVNAPGSGVADNRGLLRYDDRLINYFLNEATILPSVETYHLSDIDQLAHVVDRREAFQFKPVQDHDGIWRHCGGKRPTTPKSLSRLAIKYPEYFVAQSIPESVSLPYLRNGQIDNQPVYLRAFYILGKEPIVLPGGMGRLRPETSRIKRLTLVTSGLKDVIVPDKLVGETEPKRAPMGVGKRFSIGSRVAESLYWAGRYLERAENTARQLETLERLRWDQMAQAEQRTYWPLLQAVAAATGQSKFAKAKRPPADSFPLSRALILDSQKGASVRACVASARVSLESVREVISPECREVLEGISLYLNRAAGGRVSRNRLREISEQVVSEVARFNGTAERTMPHDDAWQFYRIGVFFERAMGILLLLEVALPRILENYQPHDEESAELTALLRLLGSLDAYRRQYRSRAYVSRVVTLLFTGNANPSSLSFCLRNLHYAISTLSISGNRSRGEHLLGELQSQIEGLKDFSLVDRKRTGQLARGDDAHLPGASEVSEEVSSWASRLEAIHERIEDRYFTHQEAFAEGPLLFDMD